MEFLAKCRRLAWDERLPVHSPIAQVSQTNIQIRGVHDEKVVWGNMGDVDHVVNGMALPRSGNPVNSSRSRSTA